MFTPTDNTVMTAELSIYETFTEAGVQHYTGADSFALNGAFVGYGVDYVQLGEATADMVAEILCDGKTTADLPYQTFDNGIVTINTETCEALGLDLDTVKEAFKPYCTEIVEVTTAERTSLKKVPSQSKPDGFASSPEGGAFGSPRKVHLSAKASPFGRGVTVGDGEGEPAFRHDPSRENGIPERPQTLRYSEIKN